MAITVGRQGGLSTGYLSIGVFGLFSAVDTDNLVRRSMSSPRRDRRLRVERLEDRHLLSAITITNNLDISNGDISSIDNLIANDGGDGISLREAIVAANRTGGADTVNFDTSGLFAAPQTLTLSGEELTILETLTIDGPGHQLLTIDADQASRIFNITAMTGDFSIAGLTLIGGNSIDDGFAGAGGAIRSLSIGILAIDQSTINDNRSTGANASGGAIFSLGPVAISRSEISGNRAAGEGALGGGIAASGDVTILDSTVSGNSTTCGSGGGIFSIRDVTLTNSIVSANTTACVGSFGGGIASARDVSLLNSTVSGNSTEGAGSRGGGISSSGETTLIQSTVSGNRTTGANAVGAGIASSGGVTLENSTVSGNSSAGSNAHGGGIHSFGDILLSHSTITGNQALFANVTGGGVWNDDDPIVIAHSIVAGNTAGGGSPDLRHGAGSLTIRYSLIGDNAGTNLVEAQTADANGNLHGSAAGQGIIDPLLGPLADNGGSTRSHALLDNSLAIDAGDTSIQSAFNLFDQRGAPFTRVANGRIDIGAFERQDAARSADFDADDDVDGFDFLSWQRGFGAMFPNAVKTDGDAENDLDVDGGDLSLWEDQFGPSVQTTSSADFDGNSVVNGADFLSWQRGFGKADAQKSDGDADNDGDVDEVDLAAWETTIGQSAAAPIASIRSSESAGGVTTLAASARLAAEDLIDAALAALWLEAAEDDDDLLVPQHAIPIEAASESVGPSTDSRTVAPRDDDDVDRLTRTEKTSSSATVGSELMTEFSTGVPTAGPDSTGSGI